MLAVICGLQIREVTRFDESICPRERWKQSQDNRERRALWMDADQLRDSAPRSDWLLKPKHGRKNSSVNAPAQRCRPFESLWRIPGTDYCGESMTPGRWK